MAGYFSQFEFQALGSEQWLDYIDKNLLQKHPGIFSRAQLEEWLYQPGLPGDATVPVSDNLNQAADMARSWSSGELAAEKLPYADWSPMAMVYFISALPAELSEAQLSELDAVLGLSRSANAEIARTWFIQVADRRAKVKKPHDFFELADDAGTSLPIQKNPRQSNLSKRKIFSQHLPYWR